MIEVYADPEKQEHAVKLFGSKEQDAAARRFYEEESKATTAYNQLRKKHSTEESLFAEMGARPYWADPFQLTWLPLFMLGVPQGSKGFETIQKGEAARCNRLPSEEGDSPEANKVRCFDYTSLGWPRSQGEAVRFATPEEDQEIRNRLRESGLTKPGSDVPTKGRTLADLFEEDPPSPPWLIEGVLRQGGAAMIYGPSGVGKTWFVHTLMLMLARGGDTGIRDTDGTEWALTCGPHSGVKVCLLDGEMVEADLSSRMKHLCATLGLQPVTRTKGIRPIDVGQLGLVLANQGTQEGDIRDWQAHFGAKVREEPQEPADERGETEPEAPEAEDEAPLDQEPEVRSINLESIILYAKAAQDHRATFVDLADPEWTRRVIEYGKLEGIDVFVFDNLSTLSPSLEDENASVAWQPLNDLIVALKREGIASIIVHHSGKSGSTYRGSSNLGTTLETMIGLDKVERVGGTIGSAAFKVRVEKNRAGRDLAVDGRTLVLGCDGWLVEDNAFEDAERAAAAVRSLKFTSQTEVAVGLNWKQGQYRVSRALKVAAAREILSKPQYDDCIRKAKDLRANPAAFEDDPLDPEQVASLDI